MSALIWARHASLEHLKSVASQLVLYRMARAISGATLLSAVDRFDDFQVSGEESQED